MSYDPSYGYEAVAKEFMAVRSDNGCAIVRQWAELIASKRPDANVLDVGAGSGLPLTSVLVDAGLNVSAMDASQTMVASFKKRFPAVEIACEDALCEPPNLSRFFGKRFDAIMSIGLIFLLPEDKQQELIRRFSVMLCPDGHLLFSAPRQTCEWIDILTGLPSKSLGADVYFEIMEHHHLKVLDEFDDEGQTHYFSVQKSE